MQQDLRMTEFVLWNKWPCTTMSNWLNRTRYNAYSKVVYIWHLQIFLLLVDWCNIVGPKCIVCKHNRRQRKDSCNREDDIHNFFALRVLVLVGDKALVEKIKRTLSPDTIWRYTSISSVLMTKETKPFTCKHILIFDMTIVWFEKKNYPEKCSVHPGNVTANGRYTYSHQCTIV